MTDLIQGGHHGNPHLETVMGTVVGIDVRDADAPLEAIDDVVRWLHHVDEVFSTHDPSSPISAMGRGELGYAEASEEIREVLRLCESVSRQTNGCFDAFGVPAPNGTSLETSGLVKGWSIECAATILEGHGCSDFCINAGGDISLRGRPSPGAHWRVGVRHPVEEHALALVLEVEGPLGVATSATYERGAHIIDPRTGQPSTTLASATVVGPDLTLADAYATAVFVMGLDALDWIRTVPGYDVFLITHEGTTHWSEGFSRYRV